MKKQEESKLGYIHYATSNYYKVIESQECACVCCLKKFRGSMISHYCKDKNGPTALCPYCWVDSVVGKNQVNYTDEQLQEWHEQGFGGMSD